MYICILLCILDTQILGGKKYQFNLLFNHRKFNRSETLIHTFRLQDTALILLVAT